MSDENIIPDGIKIREISVKDLKQAEINPVIHTKKNKEAVAKSLHEFGAVRSIGINENMEILAGNSTAKQFEELGFENVIEIETDGKTLVAVKRTDLTEEQQQRYAIMDNSAAKLAVWDAESLAQLKLNGISMEGIFTDKEFDKITMPKEKTDFEPEAGPEGETRYYVVVECEDAETQEQLHSYLADEGYNAMKYEGNKKG